MLKSLTVFEETVMLAVYRLNQDAYSVTIHQEILAMTRKDVILGTLFRTLDQLSRKGYLKKHKGEPVRVKGGKSKIFYSITNGGYHALEQTRKMHRILWNDIPEVLTKK